MDLFDLPELPAGMPYPVVLGLDPGTRIVGYGAIVSRPDGPRFLAAGVLRASADAPIPTRLGHIRTSVDELLRRLRPSTVVIEHAYTAINSQSALRIGEGRGVLLASAACSGARVIQIQASSAKKAVTGDGAADKARVARCVAAELGLTEPPRPADATDALALALTAVFRARLSGTS
ncbi:MAG: crossover junction endodeoxyribonuclease RuvC [Planctomycetota bacterium]